MWRIPAPSLSTHGCMPPYPTLVLHILLRLWLLSPGPPLCGSPSHFAWAPTHMSDYSSMWALSPSNSISELEPLWPPPLGSHHPMCGCQPCCAPPTGFKTELSRKGKGRKGRGGDRRKGKGQKRKRKTFAPADTNWNWWVFLVFLLSQLTYQPFLIWSSLC